MSRYTEQGVLKKTQQANNLSVAAHHMFTYIVQTLVNSLTISLTEWPENQKNKCLSFSANSVGLHFCDRVEKLEENGKKRKQITYKMGRKNMAGKTRVRAHLGQNFKNIIISSSFSLKLLLTVIQINFFPESVYICLKKH